MEQSTRWPICNTKFWDVDLFWNGDQPGLTKCFQQSILASVPLALLLLLCLVKLCCSCHILSSPNVKGKYPCTFLYAGKLFFSVFLILTLVTEIIYLAYLNDHEVFVVPAIDFYSAAVRLTGVVIALVLQVRQHRNGLLNSNILFIFWFLSSFCGFFMPPIFTIITSNLDKSVNRFIFILGCISYPMYIAQMFLSIFTDPEYNLFHKAEEDDYRIYHQPVLSRLFFAWPNRLICYGYRNNIEIKNLDRLDPKQKSASVYEQLYKWWSKELKKHQNSTKKPTDEVTETRRTAKPSLFSALVKAMAIPFIVATILELIFDFMSFAPALLLDWLIQFVENLNEPLWHGMVYAVGLFAASAINSLLMIHHLFYLILASFVLKWGISAALYRKTLKLSSAAKRDYTVGELCNLMGVDTQKIFELLWGVNLIWGAPIRIILSLVLLWRYLGVACLAGMSVMLIIMPITLYIASITHRLQASQMKKKDIRLRQMNEILNGIKVLKLFAWEIPFMNQISDIRTKEVTTIKKLALLNAVVVFLWSMAPFLIAITSFVTFVLMDENNVLDPSIAFVSLTLFNQLRMAMSMIPDVVTEVVQSRISFRRIQKFLLCDEINEKDIGNDVPPGKDVVVERAFFAWTSIAQETPFLCDINIEIPKGSLIGVVGQVGSGKSALLTALLGEMHITSGKINVRQGSIAYVAQQAWIQNATLQNNVLFLKPMNIVKYNDILDKCCMRDDLKILPCGDQTEIGEKGVNLSGGQKQRISLARAVYQDSDLYLLDDPLSAVDAHVGAHMFNEVIGPRGTLRKKTRILVTHDLSILPEMDTIFVMADGRIKETGSYQELMDKGGEFSKFVEEHVKHLKETGEEENEEKDEIAIEQTVPTKVDRSLSTAELKEHMKRRGSRISRTQSREDPILLMQKQKKAVKLVEKEKMEEGRVKASVFMTYFRSATFWLIILMMISFVAYQGFEVGSNFWLSKWSTDDSNDIQTRNLRIGVYGLLGLGQGLSILVAAFLLAVASTRASKILHSKMLRCVLRSPLAFFEKTPVGRILNRFGKDINVIDSNIPTVLNKLLLNLVSVIATIVIICSSSPFLLLALLPFCVFYVCVQSYYLATSRQSRRLQSVTLSPIMSNFSETIQGTSTIRAFRAQNAFIGKEDNLVDTHSRATFTCMMLNRWLSVHLELAASLLVFMVALFTVFRRSDMGPGIAGLTLSYTLNITAVIGTLVKFYTNLEIRMISVERLAEYSDLTPEAAWKLDKNMSHLSPPKEWPSEGAISFEDYQLKYQKSTSLALRGINVNVKPGEKVGIVGRTGAGKSSLTIALFRIVEPCGGSIQIDGIDISSIGLHELRGKLTIIPQDPVLFSGSLRLNLDPLNEHPDEKLWEALDHAHLKSFVAKLDAGLEYCIAEGGENISVGQRQQICLARALLKKTKILVLDEATAAVDMETDRLIQETIRREFNDCTILTIAHRLYTILDYDRIIVMHNGKVAEEGKPDFLLQNEHSMFYQLAKDAGLL